MTQTGAELISAFIDGETVEPGDLAMALTEPGARETLLDFVLLSARVHEEEDRPGDLFYRKMETALSVRHRRSAGWRSAGRLLAAAGAAAVMALTIWYVSLPPRDPSAIPDDPPAAQRELRFQWGVDWKSTGL